jgi:hypothetical protein
VRQTFLHSMECQSGIRSGAAPASISAADISACLPESVGQGSFVTEHLREVGTAFAVRGCRPWEDSPSIRSTTERHWLAPSSLARRPIGDALRRSYPGGRTTGLPRSSRVAEGPVARPPPPSSNRACRFPAHGLPRSSQSMACTGSQPRVAYKSCKPRRCRWA